MPPKKKAQPKKGEEEALSYDFKDGPVQEFHRKTHRLLLKNLFQMIPEHNANAVPLAAEKEESLYNTYKSSIEMYTKAYDKAAKALQQERLEKKKNGNTSSNSPSDQALRRQAIIRKAMEDAKQAASNVIEPAAANTNSQEDSGSTQMGKKRSTAPKRNTKGAKKHKPNDA